ncbi:MAG: substrate-binding domain-containing protein, partial [Desulfomonile sp.]|nr:substrate-binding domain-containing protein [Desulfomonile sp.]
PYAKKYEKSHPDCRVALLPGTTAEGFARLIKGEVDVVMASRKITDAEIAEATGKGIDPVSKSLGLIALAVIVNMGNTVADLTMEQLRRIFTGEVKDWSEVGGNSGPIRVTTREVPKIGIGVAFQQVVMKGAPFAKGSDVMPTYHTTAEVCRKSPGAIGYIPACSNWFKSVEYTGVRVVPIRLEAGSLALKPDVGITRQSPYPIMVPFHLYWNGKSSVRCVSEFVEFAVSQVK